MVYILLLLLACDLFRQVLVERHLFQSFCYHQRCSSHILYLCLRLAVHAGYVVKSRLLGQTGITFTF